jgi:hypothetical protein
MNVFVVILNLAMAATTGALIHKQELQWIQTVTKHYLCRAIITSIISSMTKKDKVRG